MLNFVLKHTINTVNFITSGDHSTLHLSQLMKQIIMLRDHKD